MALYFQGKSRCSLCCEVVNEDGIAFPAFLAKGHRLGKFSDGLFHENCFENWTDRDEFSRLYEEFSRIWNSRPKNLDTKEEIDAWGEKAFNDFARDSGKDDPQ